MILNASLLATIEPKHNLQLPTEAHLALPEKVLQFGTGVLLRGLPDFLIDKANKAGIFNGRIIVVKSTSQNKASDFDQQDNLFTTSVKGLNQGKIVNEYVVNAAISRVLSAQEQWQEILACAENRDLQIITSNTTEVGIVLDKEDDILNGAAPKSFPGKVLAFLYKRYQMFSGSRDAGMVIVPTELIVNNATKLKDICLKLARKHKLEEDFIQWLDEANDFCNTLVDCIVPGALNDKDAGESAQYLGYEDKLMIMSEVYRLWAIETSSKRSKEILSFAKADASTIISNNIDKFRDLKLRLLNGAHTFSCGLAQLQGFETVKDAMQDADFKQYLNSLMKDEIAPTLISDDISRDEAVTFSDAVLERFANPYLNHKWQSICSNYTSKMLGRNIPTLSEWYRRFETAPKQMAKGFAAYYLYHQMEGNTQTVHEMLADESLWKTNLSTLKGFEDEVMQAVTQLRRHIKIDAING